MVEVVVTPTLTLAIPPTLNQVSMVEVAVGGDGDGSCLLILLAAAVLLVAWFNAATLGCKDTLGLSPLPTYVCRMCDGPAHLLHLCRARMPCICDTRLCVHAGETPYYSLLTTGMGRLTSRHTTYHAYCFRYVTPPRSLLNAARLLGCRLRFCDSVY